MYFERIYDDGLAQASYIVACPGSGEAAVVDPLRDLDQYLDKIDELGFDLVGVVETHIHADFLSGGRDLARATGATLYISGEQSEGWEYAGLDGLDVVEMTHGDQFKLGNVVIEAAHTPGHTPEHLSFLVTDGAQSDEPMMALTGDFAFVGDLGRPDLLEKAAGERGTAETGAKQLFDSVKNVLCQWDDSVQIWPGHGAGSACGKALGSIPASTVGYERRNAWWGPYVENDDPEGFADELLSGQPESPTYFRNMKEMNRDGVEGQDAVVPSIPRLTPEGFREAADFDVNLLDLRDFEDFSREHIAGSVNLPSLDSLSDQAGWVVDYDRPIVLVVEPENLDEATRALYRVGFTDFEGYIPRIGGYATATDHIELIDAGRAHALKTDQDAMVLDVRSQSEFNEGHIPGAKHVHYGRLEDHLDEMPDDRPIVVHCASGRRAMVGASILESNGFENIYNFPGGVDEWRDDGFDVE